MLRIQELKGKYSRARSDGALIEIIPAYITFDVLPDLIAELQEILTWHRLGGK